MSTLQFLKLILFIVVLVIVELAAVVYLFGHDPLTCSIFAMLICIGNLTLLPKICKYFLNNKNKDKHEKK